MIVYTAGRKPCRVFVHTRKGSSFYQFHFTPVPGQRGRRSAGHGNLELAKRQAEELALELLAEYLQREVEGICIGCGAECHRALCDQCAKDLRESLR